MPGDVPAAAHFKVTFCSHGAPGSSVASRLGIHLSLGRNHSFRSKCTHPSSGRTASLLAAPARGARAGRGGRGPGAPGGGPAVRASSPPSRGFLALPGLAHLRPRASPAEPLGAPGAATQGPGLCSRGFASAPRACRAPATPPAAAAAAGARAPGRRSSSRRPPR